MLRFRPLGVLAVIALALIAPASALADTQVIPGDGTANTRKLTIYAGDNGSLQAKQGAPQDPGVGMFCCSSGGPASNFFYLRLKGAPAPNTTIWQGASGGGGVSQGTSAAVTSGPALVPVSNGPVTGNWTPMSPAQNETVLKAQFDGVDLFRIKQTVLYTGFDLKFRVVWEITNIDPQGRTIPFIFGTAADLYLDSSASGTGVFIDGPSRFVGGSNSQSRTTNGLQEVTDSRLPGESAGTVVPRWASFGEDYYGSIISRLLNSDAFANTVNPGLIDNGAGVSWNDRATQGLAPTQTVRYEAIWHARRPTPLTAWPASAVKELPGAHQVTLSLVDANFNPVVGQRVNYEVTGANPGTPASATTDQAGNVVVNWNGANVGLDTLMAYADADGDGTRDPEEPAASATVRWVADNRMEGPSQLPGNLAGPSGQQVPVYTQPNPANPEAPFYQFGRSATAAAGFPDCTFDQRSGRELNLPVGVNLQPGSGKIRNVRMFVIDPARHNPTNLTGGALPPPITPDPAQSANNRYTFIIPCVVPGEMWVEFTLEEGGNIQVFRIPAGGLQLIDPQGVVYDGARYDTAIAAGRTPEEARAEAAIAGATVRLQRLLGGSFTTLLSGDPGITPNVNPQVTPSNGIYQWDVAPGRYRVLVSATGCQDTTSDQADIPPPALDLHVRMTCGGGTTGTSGTPTGTSGTPTGTPTGATGQSGKVATGGVSAGATTGPGKVSLTGPRSVTVAKDGTFSIRLAGRAGNRGVVALVTAKPVKASSAASSKAKGKKTKPLALASKAFTIAPTGKATVKLKLSSKGFALLRAKKSIATKATATVRVGATKRTDTFSLTLRAPKGKKKN